MSWRALEEQFLLGACVVIGYLNKARIVPDREFLGNRLTV
jgi:hypothetical protein